MYVVVIGSKQLKLPLVVDLQYGINGHFRGPFVLNYVNIA